MSLDENKIAEIDANVNSLMSGKGSIDTSSPYLMEPTEQDYQMIPNTEQQSGFMDSLFNKNENAVEGQNQDVTQQLFDIQVNANDNLKTFDFETAVKNFDDRLNAYKKYRANNEETLLEAKRISEATGIPENTVLSSAEVFADAKQIYEAQQKNVDYEQLFKDNPALAKLAINGNDTMAAIAMNHVDELKEQKALIDVIKEQWRVAEIQNELNLIGKREMYGGEKIDEEKVKALYAELEKLKAPAFADDMAGSIVGGMVSQGPQMFRSQATALMRGSQMAAAGAMLGGATGSAFGGVGALPGAIAGAAKGFSAGYALGNFEGSYNEMAGSNYLQLRLQKDKNGQPMYNRDSAMAIANTQAVVSAGIETFAVGKFLRIMGGAKGVMASEVKDIVKNAVSKEAAYAGLGTWLRTSIANGVKTFGKGTLNEMLEEGAQAGSDDIILNAYNYYSGKPLKSLKEIAGDVVTNALEAGPASAGYAGVGTVIAGSSASVRRAARALGASSKIKLDAEKNARGVTLLNNLRESVANSKLFKSDPETAKQVLKENLEGSGFENVYVDAAELRQSGQTELLEQVVNSLDLSDEIKQNIIDGKEELNAPVTLYQLATADIDEKLNDYISFDANAFSFAKNKRFAEIMKDGLKAITERDLQEEKAITDIILENGFAEEDREAAAQFIEQYGLRDANKELRKQIRGINSRINEIIDTYTPEYKPIKIEDNGMNYYWPGRGYGHFTDSNGEAVLDVDISGDVSGEIKAGRWQWNPFVGEIKQEWVERSGATNKEARREVVSNALLGNNPYDLFGADTEYMQGVMDEYASLQAEKARLQKLQQGFEGIANNDDVIARGLTNEGYQVYKNVMAQLKNASTAEAREAAQFNAVLLARHADRYAGIVREFTNNKEYTALDYMADVGIEANADIIDKNGLNQPMEFRNRRYIADASGETDIYTLTSALQFSDGTVMPVAPVRLQLGFQVGQGENGAGLTHILFRHEQHIKDRGFTLQNGDADVYGAIKYVFENLQEISKVKTKNNTDRYVLWADGPNKVMALSMDLEKDPSTGEQFYTIVNMSPRSNNNLKKVKKNTLHIPALRAMQNQQPAAGTLLPSLGIISGSKDSMSTRRNSVFGTSRITNLGPLVKKFVYNSSGERVYDDDGNLVDKTKLFIPDFEDVEADVDLDYFASDGYNMTIDEVYKQLPKGQITFDGEKSIISLLQTADQSTFAHEMGHLFLRDLEQLANMEGCPEQVKQDWETVKEWTTWKTNSLEEYKGTDLYGTYDEKGKFVPGEFNVLNAKINKAIKEGNTAEAERLKGVWAQERWARGWEEYLRQGKAPVSSLKRVFRQFKQWLCSIYQDFLQVGGAPSPEVKAVMDRMIATQEEIDFEAKRSSHNSFVRAGGLNFLAESNQAMFEKYWTEAQEEAKEQVLKLAMQDITEHYAKERQEYADGMRETIEAESYDGTPGTIFAIQEELAETEAGQREEVFAGLLELANMTAEEYAQELQSLGNSREAYINSQLQMAMDMYDNDPAMKENIKAQAQEAINKGEYADKLNEFEIAAMMQKGAIEQRIGKMADEKLAAVEKELSEIDANDNPVKKINKLQQKINDLKYTIRWNEAETDMLLKIQKAADKAKARIEKAEAVAKARAEEKAKADARLEKEKAQHKQDVKEAEYNGRWREAELNFIIEEEKGKLREQIDAFNKYRKDTRQGLRVNRDATKGLISQMRRYAQDIWNSEKPLSETANERYWRKKAREANYEYNDLLAKEEYAEAAAYKVEECRYNIYAEVARKNQKQMEKVETRLKNKLKTLKKNDHVAANQRYIYQSIMQAFDLAPEAEYPMPSDFPGVQAVLQEMAEAGYVMEYNSTDDNMVPDWILSAADGNKQAINDLTAVELRDLNNFMNMLYKSGSKQMVLDKDGNKIEVAQGAMQIRNEANERMAKIQEAGKGKAHQEETKRQWLARLARKANANILQMETVFDMLGPTAHNLIYDRINDASMKELRMLGETTKQLENLFKETLNKESKTFLEGKYKFGDEVLSGSELLAIALNCGTQSNKSRVFSSFNVTEQQLNEALSNLGANEWAFVEGVWGMFEERWPQIADVQIAITGGMAKKEQAYGFYIKGKDGQMRYIKGGYYPIRYDSRQGTRTQQLEASNNIRAMSNTAAGKNTGTGFTKERVANVTDQVLSTNINLVSSMLAEQVHFITMRQAYLDARAVVNNQEFKNCILEQFGSDMYSVMSGWVEHQWANQNGQKGLVDGWASWARTAMTLGALSYRLTTALINVANIATVSLYLGPKNTISALHNFYGRGMVERSQEIFSKSVFVAQRAEVFDANIRENVQKQVGIGKWKKLKETEQKLLMAGFKPIMLTDMMLALPAWQFEYERVYREADPTKRTPEQIEADAIRAGDKAVRKCFGSGMKQDVNALQRGSEMTKTLTTFYSYFAVVHNMVASKVAEGRRIGYQGGDWKAQAAPIANGILCMYIMQSIIDAAVRQAMKSIGDDEWDWESFGKKSITNIADNVFGAIPVARDVVPRFLEAMMGERVQDVRIPIVDIGLKAINVAKDSINPKKDKIDVTYDMAKLLSVTTGFSDPVLNAVPTTMRYIDDFENQSFMEYLKSVALAKKLKKSQ